MGFVDAMDSILSAFLTRDQRERHTRSKWDRSVAQAARELGLEDSTPRYVAGPVTPPSSPVLGQRTPLTLDTAIPPTSYPMTPSLSSASSSSSSSMGSPTRSRPGTSYSTSPRPGFRRHTSIPHNPISYDSLISPTKAEKPRRSSSETPQTLLYPLPPLEPMEGIGRYRRSVHSTDDYLHTLERNDIAALRPLINEDERVSRFRRSNQDTTTPPRAYSTSPSHEDIARRQLQMQTSLERWTKGLELVASPEIMESEEEHIPPPPPPPPQTTTTPSATRRSVRVATKRRAQNGRERGGRAGRRAPQQAGGLTRNLKHQKPAVVVANGNGHYKPKPGPRGSALSASMETLLSGEE